MASCLVPASILLLLLAGCMGPSAPATPTGDGAPWSAWSGPFLEDGRTYGFIPVDDEGYGPEGLRYVALDREGHVLGVEYRYRMRDDGPGGLVFGDAAQESWRPVVEPLFRDGAIYGDKENPSRVKVDAVNAATLAAPDRDRVLEALDAALARAREPQPVGIADCGFVVLRTAQRTATLNCGQGDPGWEEAHRQMDLLWEWVTAPS